MDVLRKCISPAAVDQALKTLPETLDETYERILLSIPADKSKDALRILQWLVFSTGPLHVDHIAELAVADPEGTLPFDLSRRPFNPEEFVSYCGSLVLIQPGSKWTRLAHFSVQEFLISDRIQLGQCSKYSIVKQPSQIAITRTCLAYLSGIDKQGASIYNKSKWEEFPLYHYAVRSWTLHAKAAGGPEITDLDHEISEFLTNDTDSTRWLQYQDGADLPLYRASFAGLYGLVKLLLNNKVNVNTQGGEYALLAASQGGHLEIT
jgi:hypothetical protein